MDFETIVVGELEPQLGSPSYPVQPESIFRIPAPPVSPSYVAPESPSNVLSIGEPSPSSVVDSPSIPPATLLSPSAPPSDRPPTPLDAARYLATYGDLIERFGYDLDAASDHYFNYGRFEGRLYTEATEGDSVIPAPELFPISSYLSQYEDLQTVYGEPGISLDAEKQLAVTRHYIEHGYSELRNPYNGGFFDESLEYIASYDDLIGQFGLNAAAGAQHYWQYGQWQGRQVTFQADEYIASYHDLIETIGYNLDAAVSHFISYGSGEGRDRDRFDAAAYLSAFDDVRATFGNDLDAATRHYIQHGYFEGRVWEA